MELWGRTLSGHVVFSGTPFGKATQPRSLSPRIVSKGRNRLRFFCFGTCTKATTCSLPRQFGSRRRQQQQRQCT
eukprot:3092079-Amphidinium_carterae.1